jgi:hypothetical protein
MDDATSEIYYAQLVEAENTFPTGMTHSTYRQPLPMDLQPGAVLPYEGDGTRTARWLPCLTDIYMGGSSLHW